LKKSSLPDARAGDRGWFLLDGISRDQVLEDDILSR
jgi:hypothetical protein